MTFNRPLTLSQGQRSDDLYRLINHNMADSHPMSKSAKKNQKRRAAAKKKAAVSQGSGGGGGTLSNSADDVPGVRILSRRSPSPPPPPLSVDPITALKLQIEEAKAAKDHEKAQHLRQQLWVLQDTVHLGTAGPGAPVADVSSLLPPPAPSINQVQGLSAGNPTEKKLNKLLKKLQQIQALKERFAGGEQLESTQLAKIKSEEEVQEEIDFLQKLLEQTQLK